jgi:hypothetical protein
MDHGGYRTARIGNRHALHSVYYSTTKKAASPLNEACTHARSDTMRGRQARNSIMTARAILRRDALVHETQKFKKHAMKQGFL